MDKELIEKYKKELMKMYRSSPAAHQTPAVLPVQNTMPDSRRNNTAPAVPPAPVPENRPLPPDRTQPAPVDESTDSDENGRLVGIITTLRGLYPVPNAKVTIFTGPFNKESLDAIATAISDASGKTIAIELYAPPRDLSLQSGSATPPYSTYNMLVEADGYADNVHLNIPIFRGVTSLQRSDMVLRSAAEQDSPPIIFNESMSYDL